MDIKEESTTVVNTSKYVYLIDKILNMIQSENYDRRLLQLYLCDLIDMDHRIYVKKSNTCSVLIQNLCIVIQNTDIELIKLHCQYLTQLIKNGIILKKNAFYNIYKWIMCNIQCADLLVINDLLSILRNTILSDPDGKIINEFQELIIADSPFQKLAKPENQWNETNFLTLRCLEAYLMKGTKDELTISSENLLAIKNIVINVLRILPRNINDKNLCNKTIYLCFRILHTIISSIDTTDWPDMIGEMLGVIQAYLFHGIKECSIIEPEFLHPAAMNLPEREQPIISKRNTHSQNKSRERRMRSKKSSTETTPKTKMNNSNCNNEVKTNIRTSSDSDTSDTETLNLNITNCKVQLKVLQLLSLLKDTVSSRELFGYWPQIIACNPESSKARVLTRFLLKVPDPTKKVRQVALSVLAEIIEGAKNFLIHAEEVEHSTFLPFFGMVSAMIKELHYALLLLLSNMKNFLVLTQVLKCVNALVQSTPYSRMNPGLATKLIRNCRVYLLHSDPTIRVAVLLVFDALASVNPMTDEINSILEKSSVIDINSDIEIDPQIVVSDIEADTDKEEFIELEVEELDVPYFEENVPDDSEEKKMSSLLRVCLHNIAKETVHDPVRIQSLRLLRTIASNAGQLISDHIELIAATLVTGMKSLEPQIALHTCRAAEAITECLSSPKCSNVNPFSFWNIIFEPTISLTQHTQGSLREAACYCLSTMGADTLSRLSRNKIILIITILFGAVRDEESGVRAAGIRALGVLVTVPVIQDDTGFLMDLADISALAMEDKNLGVCIKASWTLANLCDTILNRDNNSEDDPLLLELVMPKLFEASINAANSNNKLKSNAMRALGSIMSICTGLHILTDTSEGLNALISCATNSFDMKIRWNACHALGLILSRDPDQILPQSWKDQVFPVLSSLICDSINFKVRINAAWTITVCKSFGKYIPSLWKNIILALENAQHVPNYVEYAHHDALVQQLCLAFCHIALFTDLSDLQVIWPDISEHIKDLHPFMKHFQLHILPEKAGELLSAKAKFNEFLQEASTPKEKMISEALVDLLEKTSVLEI